MSIMSPDEGLEIIRAEILAQDWRLSPASRQRLGRALDLFAGRVQGRRGFYYIHSMCGGILAYLEKHGDGARPAAIDLLKECLAHLLPFFDGRESSSAREAEIFHAAFGRFQKLKKEIRQDTDRTCGIKGNEQ